MSESSSVFFPVCIVCMRPSIPLVTNSLCRSGSLRGNLRACPALALSEWNRLNYVRVIESNVRIIKHTNVIPPALAVTGAEAWKAEVFAVECPLKARTEAIHISSTGGGMLNEVFERQVTFLRRKSLWKSFSTCMSSHFYTVDGGMRLLSPLELSARKVFLCLPENEKQVKHVCVLRFQGRRCRQTLRIDSTVISLGGIQPLTLQQLMQHIAGVVGIMLKDNYSNFDLNCYVASLNCTKEAVISVHTILSWCNTRSSSVVMIFCLPCVSRHTPYNMKPTTRYRAGPDFSFPRSHLRSVQLLRITRGTVD